MISKQWLSDVTPFRKIPGQQTMGKFSNSTLAGELNWKGQESKETVVEENKPEETELSRNQT